MKVELNPKELTTTPCEDTSFLDNENIINQFVQFMKNTENTCVLISGYRGTGKTSLINKVKKKLIVDDNIFFITIETNKYKDYKSLLRQLIRKIYLEIEKNKDKKRNKIKKEGVSLIQSLYDQTFYEVVHNINNKIQKSKSIHVELKADLKKLIPKILLIIIIGIIDIFKIKYFSFENITKSLFWGAFIWTLIESAFLVIKMRKEIVNTETLDRKSLYDDEIAEYQLKKVLSIFKENGKKVIIVFDEIDKIEVENERNKLISDLKPLILSGLGSFILITGQKMYYQYSYADINDDSIISSVFSKVVHVPLQSSESFYDIFKSISNPNNLILTTDIKYFIDSLILESNRTIRTFINLILQKIIWDNDVPYIYINTNENESLKLDSRLLELLNQVIKEHIDTTDYSSAIKDFFIIQLHIWLKRMKIKNVPFSKSDILNFEIDYKGDYPSFLEIPLSILCDKLLGEMSKQGILKSQTKETEETIYAWIEKPITTDSMISVDKFKMDYISKFIEVERVLRNIYAEFEQTVYTKKTKNLDLICIGLVKQKFISDGFYGEFRAVYNIRNRIVHAETIKEKELLLIMDRMSVFDYLESTLYRNYAFKLCNDILTGLGYDGNKLDGFKDGFDFVFKKNNDETYNLLFEVKITQKILYSESYSYKFISAFEKSNNHSNNYLIVIWFTPDVEGFKEFEEKINRILKEEQPILENKIFSILMSSDNTAFINKPEFIYQLDNIIKDNMSDNTSN